MLLKTGAKNPAAAAFVKVLKSPEAIAIIKRYGYEIRPAGTAARCFKPGHDPHEPGNHDDY